MSKQRQRTEYLSSSGKLDDQLNAQGSQNLFNKVIIIGLGQLGLPVAKYVRERGFETYGYDISTEAMNRAEKTAAIKMAPDFRESNYHHDFDVYILSVSTHKPDDIFSPQIDGLLTVVNRISKRAKKGALLSIESTVPLGTTRKINEMLDHRLHVVHAPHRWYALEEEYHGVNQPRVIGGVSDCCIKTGLEFYGRGGGASADKCLGIPMHPVSKVEVAELTKVVENSHRYLQIAFAEELYLYCQGNKISFPELRDALNTKWNVDILEPREGIGGHCLPKDTKMFLESSQSIRSKILPAAMQIDYDYRKYLQSIRPETK
jgi:UDP-N-acetyl-D-mannosaminuronic acid dehydrogenase